MVRLYLGHEPRQVLCSRMAIASVHAVYMPFAPRYVEKRVKRAVCCVLSYCVYVVARIRVLPEEPFFLSIADKPKIGSKRPHIALWAFLRGLSRSASRADLRFGRRLDRRDCDHKCDMKFDSSLFISPAVPSGKWNPSGYGSSPAR